MKRLSAIAAALLLVTACSSDRSSSSSTTGDTTDSTSVDTTTDGTTASTVPGPTTNPATTTGDTTGTTEVCVPEGDLDPKASDDPLFMSGLVGTDIRTGVHPCYERLVIELGGSGDFPGWSVEYVNDPVQLGASGESVAIAGDATLQVIMRMWMPSMEGDGYAGPIQVFPAGVSHILELRETENFEGVCVWSIGLDAEYPFTVDVFHGPERLVIDFQVPSGG